jgi:hypothetical protein
MAAASGVSEQELAGLSKVAMNAYAVDLEAQREQIAETMYKAAAVAMDGIAMYDLFTNPAKAADLSICTLDALLNNGGIDTFTEIFLPVITMINNGGQMPEPQAPQPMMQPQMVQSAPQIQQPRQFGWDGGQAPTQQARASFPAMPAQSNGGGGATSLDHVAPHERWKAIDMGLIG